MSSPSQETPGFPQISSVLLESSPDSLLCHFLLLFCFCFKWALRGSYTQQYIGCGAAQLKHSPRVCYHSLQFCANSNMYLAWLLTLKLMLMCTAGAVKTELCLGDASRIGRERAEALSNCCSFSCGFYLSQQDVWGCCANCGQFRTLRHSAAWIPNMFLYSMCPSVEACLFVCCTKSAFSVKDMLPPLLRPSHHWKNANTECFQ